jgi:Domain of unknown function (DUF4159)
MHAPLNPPNQEKKKNLIQRLLRIEYFVIAFLAHLFLLLVFGGKVLFDAVSRKNAFEPGAFIETGGEVGPTPPPSLETPQETPQEIVIQTSPAPSTPTEVFTNDIVSPESFTIPPPSLIAPNMDALQEMTQITKPTPVSSAQSFSKRAASVRKFTNAWAPPGESGSGGQGPVGFGAQTKAVFTCYIAKAGGINPGDYHSLDKTGKIDAGPVPNLLHMINAWSSGRIKADNVPVPLDLASQVIFEKKPPFIYLAGYGDFKLTPAEITNLQKYLMSGGAIWGDSGLAGVGSKFDLAFRREMKLVIPDIDKNFEALPPDHPIYRGDKAFFQLKAQPPGMNFRNDPVEVVKIDDEIAILYTPNNYTDMAQMGFMRPVKISGNAEGKFPSRVWKERYPWLNERQRQFQEDGFFFGNFTVDGSEEVFRFSINIIVHLLTRFQEKLAMAP